MKFILPSVAWLWLFVDYNLFSGQKHASKQAHVVEAKQRMN
jgi:hypothetical protein